MISHSCLALWAFPSSLVSCELFFLFLFICHILTSLPFSRPFQACAAQLLPPRPLALLHPPSLQTSCLPLRAHAWVHISQAAPLIGMNAQLLSSLFFQIPGLFLRLS